MFKIAAADCNCDVKIHLVANRYIADVVKADLESRFGPMKIEEVEGNEYVWDPGGMLLMGDTWFTFPLPDTTISCQSQHFEKFVSQANKSTPRGEGIKYVKLHGHWSCCCVSVDEFNKLKSLFTDDLYTQAQESFERWERGVKQLHQNGACLQAVQADDGKVSIVNFEENKVSLN